MPSCSNCNGNEFIDDYITNDTVCTNCGVVSGPAFIIRLDDRADRCGRTAVHCIIRRGRGLDYIFTCYNVGITHNLTFSLVNWGIKDFVVEVGNSVRSHTLLGVEVVCGFTLPYYPIFVKIGCV